VSNQDYASWIGRTRSMTDVILPDQAVKLAATLDCAPPPWPTGDPLPAGWHWCYFHEVTPLSGIGRDGHQALGEFLPPVDLPRRMWASGEIEITQPLGIGETVDKTPQSSPSTKSRGAPASWCSCAWATTYRQHEAQTCARCTRSSTARPLPPMLPTPPPQLPQESAEWSRDMTAGPVQLFRYSALTFNSHRIHYDVDFCRNEEGYDGLIIHGPLTATMLMEAARELEPARALKKFSFRAVSPLTHVHPFSLHARHTEDGMSLWACNHRGELAMTATAALD
jgi:3-methylfumaryl-CoA hydratase